MDSADWLSAQRRLLDRRMNINSSLKIGRISKLTKGLVLVFVSIFIIYILIILLNYSTLSTVKKLNNHPLYVMTYKGDYQLGMSVKLQDVFLSSFLDKSEVNEQNNYSLACTSFMSPDNSNGFLYGRNLDLLEGEHPALLLFTNPSKGYASVSMVELGVLGYNNKGIFGRRLPDMWYNKSKLLLSPYVPRDGMNEYGLAVSTLNVPHSEAPKEKGKETIGRWTIMRLMLDYAKDVEEAIELLKKYNLFTGSSGVHYLISDASGDSVVVEFLDNKIIVVQKNEKWQVASNFILSKTEKLRPGLDRFERANEYLEATRGEFTNNEALNLLKTVSQPHTVWSTVYNLTTGEITVSTGRDYSNIYKFKLSMKNVNK